MHDTTANEIEAEKVEEKEESNSQQDNEATESEDSENDKKEQRFKKGQILTFVRVRFPGNAKSFPFLSGKRNFSYGQKVVAMSDRGMTVGYINSFPYETEFNESMLPIRSIAKVASEEDIQEQKDNLSKEREAEALCIRLIEKHELNMNLTHVEFIQFGKKAVFYFTAPERVDFRGLVKDLVADLKMRIELRQISVRDRAAAIGAVGACGLQTCCSSFLKGYGSVSIKMAKNQNLALIPSKINGVCGQIKCCIKYEDKVYTDKRKDLPSEGKFIEVKNGDRGKVTKLHIIIEQFEMLTETGYRRRYTKDQFDPEIQLPEDWSWPERLPHVIDETSNVVGVFKEDPLEEDHFYWYHNTLHDDENSNADKEAEEKTSSKDGDETSKQEKSESDDRRSGQRRNNRTRNNSRNKNNKPRNNNSNDNEKKGDKSGPNNRSGNRNRNKNKRRRPNKKPSGNSDTSNS